MLPPLQPPHLCRCRPIQLAPTCGRRAKPPVAEGCVRSAAIQQYLALDRTLVRIRFTLRAWALSVKSPKNSAVEASLRWKPRLLTCSSPSMEIPSLPIWPRSFPNLVPAGVTPCTTLQVLLGSGRPRIQPPGAKIALWVSRVSATMAASLITTGSRRNSVPTTCSNS